MTISTKGYGSMSYVLGLKCKECGNRTAGLAGARLRGLFRAL